MTTDRVLMFLILFGAATGISLLLVGIPAVLLKLVAGMLGAPDRRGIVRRSIVGGMLAGSVMIAIQMLANQSVLRMPDLHAAITSLGGRQWTAIGFAVLAAMAIAVDYRMVLRPLQPRLSPLRAAVFLAVSNLWVVEGAWLLGSYNKTTLFETCFDPATKRFVDTYYEPRPAICEQLSD